MTRPNGDLIKPETIEDLPQKVVNKEIKVDFHSMFPISLYNRLEAASNSSGYGRNEIVVRAVTEYLKGKKEVK